MAELLTGLKIRTLRKESGLTQAELARLAGISPSYLNLIELSKRPASGDILSRVAEGLGVEPTRLQGEAERGLAASLSEIAADPALHDPALAPGPAEDFVGRHPGWARLMLRLYRAYVDGGQTVLALADRLNRDPFLGDSVHRMLTNVTSIQSAAEILSFDEALGEEDRARFLSIVATDSERLSATARALAAFFDNEEVRVRSATPMELVDAFIFESDNHFPALEAAAETFRAGLRGAERCEDAAARLLADNPPAKAATDAPETQRFRLVERMAETLFAGEAAAIADAAPALASPQARALALPALFAYAAAAMLMPYERFLEAARAERYDLDLLARRFGVSYEQAAHRLATLRRPGAEGVRFAFMRSDPSGYVTKRLPLSRLPLPRYGNACPLWVVHGAFQSPGVTARAFGALPSGEAFLFFARAVDKSLPRPGYPRHLLSVMLACRAEEAGLIVYGDGIDRSAGLVPVGTVCRLCPRPDCAHRQEPMLLA